jgi:hypothetical protein
MEQECRFNGKPYPEGLAPFPGRLTGQGFFPGGDGLWRGDTQLHDKSQFPFPVGGIMFLGNDFGTLDSFKTVLRRGYENPPTWRNLKLRLDRAGIPGQLGFFTNAFLGLRTQNKALDAIDWTNHPEFGRFCREFLEFQIETVKPRLVVVLGPKAKQAVYSDIPEPLIHGLAKWKSLELKSALEEEVLRQGEWQGIKLTFLLTSHPYSDLGKNDAAKAADTARLARAWELAQS